WASAPARGSFEPPQPWNMPTTGYGPSGLPSVGAGGNATLTSSGMPSKLGICAVDVPQNRCPDACTAQLTGDAVFVNTCGIAASAVDGTIQPAAAMAAAASILLRMGTPPPLGPPVISPRRL